MRLSIRLQQHGKKNHPYWWIVVAPQHKNIFGRFTDHIGFWSPRHNVNIKRQIIFNVPRLKYWIANGAIPTPKVHKFMTMFGILPQQWHYKKSPQQLAQIQAKKKPYEQMNAKEKSLEDRRRKRKERQQLAPYNYHRYESMAMFPNKLKERIMAKQHSQQFQNSVIRDALHESDFQKYDRIAELSGNSEQIQPIFQQLKKIKDKIKKAKSELNFLEKKNLYTKILPKSRLMQKINVLTNQLNEIQRLKQTLNLPEDVVNDQEYVTEEYLQKKLQYELITKKLKKTQQQIQNIDKVFEPMSLNDFYQKLKQLREKKVQLFANMPDDDIYQFCLQFFEQRALTLSPVTSLDLAVLQQNEIAKYYLQVDQEQQDQQEKKQHNNIQTALSLVQCILSHNGQLPSYRPVHPRPDLKTYIPEEHYDPIETNKLDIMMMDSLQPHQQLQKYHRKRNSERPISERKEQSQKKRMERLKIITQN